jgi:carboxypeptidase Taq
VHSPWEDFAIRAGELKDLAGVVSVLTWDQETMMPPRGVAARAEHLATMQGLIHQRLAAPELGEALEAVAADPSLDEQRRAMVRVQRAERDRALALPAALVMELARAQSRAVEAWKGARERSDYPSFAPHLERLLALRREMARCWLPLLDRGAPGASSEPYDALLEGYEPGMRVARLEPMLRRLANFLAGAVPVLAQRSRPRPAFLSRRFDAERQWRFTLGVLDALGFDREAGRQDRSVHPFCMGIDPGDVRVTTRIFEELPFSAVFSTVHEAGHALYEQGLPEELRRTPVCAAPSMGLHESQSRLWENMVARSLPFWEAFLPRLAAEFPSELEGVSPEEVHRAVNRVERSLVRVEADEVTYNLHIVLRFDLELALLRGALPVADLPAAWDDRMERDLGVRPPSDAQGVLQDIHWAWGELGYFPTYAIGNLYAAALLAEVRRALPHLDRDLRAAQFGPLREWLREKVHRHGRVHEAEELVRRATGAGLDEGPFIAYLREKYGAMHGVAL